MGHRLIIPGIALLLTACAPSLVLHAATTDPSASVIFSGASGTAEVEGYATAIVVENDACPAGECDSQLYLHFTVLRTDAPDLEEFLRQQSGNAYAGPGTLGLGCLAGRSIRYQNASDALGMQEFLLPEEVSSAILRSTKQSPLRLKLKKLPLSTAGGGPVCYAHFTTVELAG